MLNVLFIFYLVKFVVCNIKALLTIHSIIAGTTIRIITEKLKEGSNICRQIYLNISLLMGIMFF